MNNKIDDLESPDFGVIERQCLGILRIHFNRLRPSGGIDEIAVDRLRFRDDDRAGDPGDPDLTVGIPQTPPATVPSAPAHRKIPAHSGQIRSAAHIPAAVA